MPTASSLLPSVIQLSREAGAAILDVYAKPFEVINKADESPLTLADLRSHELIVRGLQQLTPDIPVLSEEASDISFEVRRQWKCFWLIDPLDGTKEFVSRNGEFTVNIALIEQHAPVLGVVYVPITDTTYSGAGTNSAQRQKGGERAVAISVQTHAPERLRIVGSRSHGMGSLDAILPRLGPHELVKIGSSLKFCMVAEGSADFYPRFGPTSEWDTAAAQAVVEAAGGAVVSETGKPLAYNTKAELLNPNFMVFGDRSRDWLALLKPDAN